MNRILSRATAAIAAALLLAACDVNANGGANAAADSTQPAGTRPAPTPQTNAAPQTGPNTPPAEFTEPPVENRDTVHRMGPAQTYASCIARARAASEDERPLLEQTCKRLPDAPK
ncbi:hypothetical protein [Longimicrobium sp.]|uniref:hypothetical protein n=1 Tax=Longimicrobium sp. TaxID=2029185 RepID=UPI002C224B8D|nr:hypothetical protein [Longimicrobium sp.]HSU17934.1 hypothetical protein [Longimicrobium sp.]